MAKFQSTKLFDGFSCVFRQWKAEGTHCKFLHGYGVSFRVWFEGELDERNWVWDFGGMKRAKGTIDGMNPKAWMDYMFDHTMIVAEDDPYLEKFMELQELDLAEIVVMDGVGAEKFAEHAFNFADSLIRKSTNDRCYCVRVECAEHGANSAIYEG